MINKILSLFGYQLKKITKPKVTLIKLGKSLRSYRELNSISSNDFAKILGISQAYLSMLENGKREPSFQVFIKIIRELDIDFLET